MDGLPSLAVGSDGLRVAVVGSGPAGFYAAGPLLTAGHEVDIIERLPTPWGLVRLGVAPDHPQLKTVSRAFEKIAAQPGFRFLGNVEVGRDLTHDDLVRLYDAVIYSYGSAADRRLGIPGEDLRGSWAATELVAWYNGHPDYQQLDFDLVSAERVVVVGNGNVALDVARMLALTHEEIAPTDATDDAIDAITSSSIRELVVLGRRGPVQASWTSTELHEMGDLAGADIVVDPAELELDPASAAELDAASNIVKRNMEILREFATREPAGKPRRVVLRFGVSPVAVLGEERVEGVELVRNELVPDGGSVRAQATGERETLSCELVFRSVGYRGVPCPGLPFDEGSGTMPNEEGRVRDESGEPLPGVYCAGWIKRGPTGVIGTNKKDATETVEALLKDAEAGLIGGTEVSAEAVEALLAERGVGAVIYSGWEAIDAVERSAGEPQGRPRVKLTTWDDLLAAARGPK